jgi:hypothetical protein
VFLQETCIGTSKTMMVVQFFMATYGTKLVAQGTTARIGSRAKKMARGPVTTATQSAAFQPL